MVSLIICSSIFFIEIVMLTWGIIVSNKVHRQDLAEWKERNNH